MSELTLVPDPARLPGDALDLRAVGGLGDPLRPVRRPGARGRARRPRRRPRPPRRPRRQAEAPRPPHPRRWSSRAPTPASAPLGAGADPDRPRHRRRDPARRRLRLHPARPDRRRRRPVVRRGPRLHQRHLPRHASGSPSPRTSRSAPRSGSARRSSSCGSSRIADHAPRATPRSPTSGGSARTTRTPGTPVRAARRRRRHRRRRRAATSPRHRRRSSCAGSTRTPAEPTTTCSTRSPAPCTAPTTGSASWSTRTPRSTAWARPPPRALRRRAARHRATSATPAPTCCATASSASSPPTTRSCRRLIDEGRITEEEARAHPHRNLILKALDGVHDGRARPVRASSSRPATGSCCAATAPAASLDDGRLADILATGAADYAAVELVRASLEAGSTDNVTCVVADVVEADRRRRRARAVLVGAAAELRRAAARRRLSGLFRGHRAGDTGELEPVDAEIPTTCRSRSRRDPIDPEAGALRAAAAAPLRLAQRLLGARSSSSACSGSALAVAWSLDASSQYYVGEDGRRTSSIFRGVNADLPGLDAVAALRDAPTSSVDLLTDFDADAGRATASTPAQPRRRRGAPVARASADRARARRRRRPARPERTDAATPARAAAAWASCTGAAAGAELFLLVLALAVGIGAYAAVGLGVEGEVPADIVAYGGWLAALVDRRAPRRCGWSRRTPTRSCCPSSPLLNGLGLAMIHRLDLAPRPSSRDSHDYAQQQLTWMTARRGPVRRRRWSSSATTGSCSGSPTPSGSPRSCCCCCRCCPGIGTDINGARIWIHVGPFSFQPGEVAKILLVDLLRRLPRACKRDALALAGRRFARHRPAARPRPRPDPGRVAGQPRRPGLPARPRLVAAVLRPLRGDALRRDRAAGVAGRRRRCCSLAGAFVAYPLFGHVQARVDIWLDPFARRTARRRLPDRRRRCSAWPGGGLLGRGLGQGSPTASRSPTPTSSSPRSARSSA